MNKIRLASHLGQALFCSPEAPYPSLSWSWGAPFTMCERTQFHNPCPLPKIGRQKRFQYLRQQVGEGRIRKAGSGGEDIGKPAFPGTWGTEHLIRKPPKKQPKFHHVQTWSSSCAQTWVPTETEGLPKKIWIKVEMSSPFPGLRN